jgi:hypothetical protein
MTKPVSAVPNTFATANSTIPLSQLDTDFSTVVGYINDLTNYSNYAVDTGNPSAYVVNFSTGITTSSLSAGLSITFKAINNNSSGASTLTVQVNSSTIGSATIKDGALNDLASGAIVAGSIYTVDYNGTYFVLRSSVGSFPNVNVFGSSIPYNGIYTPNGLSLGFSTQGIAKALITANGQFQTFYDASINGINVGNSNDPSNTILGYGIGVSTYNNTLVGYRAGNGVTGSFNCAFGQYAMWLGPAGQRNSAFGYGSLAQLTNDANCAFGYVAGQLVNTGNSNCFIGYQSGIGCTSGSYNSCLGPSSGYLITTGNYNTYVGGFGGSTTINAQVLDLTTSNNYICLSDGQGILRFIIDGTGATHIPSGLIYFYQPTQTSKSAAATLTGAELVTGILQYTGAAATITVPTATNITAAVSTTMLINTAFDWTVVNTGSGTCTIGANSNTTVGALTVTNGTSAQFRFRKTAANAYTIYRIS